MRQTFSRRLLAALLAVGTAGCASAIEQAPPSPPMQNEAQTMQSLEAVTEAVLADAAKRTGLDQASLQVESAQAVTWPDGSLGCPQPGMTYTMAPVPGYRIKVRAGGQPLDYHASRRGYFVLCPAGPGDDPSPVAQRR